MVIQENKAALVSKVPLVLMAKRVALVLKALKGNKVILVSRAYKD